MFPRSVACRALREARESIGRSYLRQGSRRCRRVSHCFRRAARLYRQSLPSFYLRYRALAIDGRCRAGGPLDPPRGAGTAAATGQAGRVHASTDRLARSWELLGLADRAYIVGDNARAMRLASALLGRGFDIRGIRPPTVPEGTARLRISVTLNVGEEDVRAMLDALTEETRDWRQ